MRSSRTFPGHRCCSSTATAVRRQPAHALAKLSVIAVDIPLREEHDITAPLAQRRQLDGHDLEPIEEILPEPTGLHLILEIPVGRRNHPDIDADVGQATHPLEGLLLEKSQQLGLQCWRHLADLIEEHRSAIRGLEQPPLLLTGVGECAAFVTEEFAFEQLLGQRRTCDVDERLRGAVAVIVNRLRRQVLPGARLSRQETVDAGLDATRPSSALTATIAGAWPMMASKLNSRLWLVR